MTKTRRHQCIADTPRGTRCLNTYRPGVSFYCPGHDPANRCNAPTKAGGKCSRKKELGLDTCSKHLD